MLNISETSGLNISEEPLETVQKQVAIRFPVYEWETGQFLKRRVVTFQGKKQEEILVQWAKYGSIKTWEPYESLSNFSKKKLGEHYKQRLQEEIDLEEANNDDSNDESYEVEVSYNSRQHHNKITS